MISKEKQIEDHFINKLIELQNKVRSIEQGTFNGL